MEMNFFCFLERSRNEPVIEFYTGLAGKVGKKSLVLSPGLLGLVRNVVGLFLGTTCRFHYLCIHAEKRYALEMRVLMSTLK